MVFIDNKYSRIYFNIINQAKSRIINGYTEKHHIIPKSLGGNNRMDNIVKLTAREHFICHRLLVKMTTNDAKRRMIIALWAMSKMDRFNNRYVPNSRVFQRLREEYIKTMIGRKLPQEVIEKIKKGNKGKVQSEETKRKRADKRRGSKHSLETILKIKESAKCKPPMNEETKQKIREARAKQVIITKQVTCPHCGKTGGDRIMPRYHFDNCKTIPR